MGRELQAAELAQFRVGRRGFVAAAVDVFSRQFGLRDVAPKFIQRERNSGYGFVHLGGLGNGWWRGALRVTRRQTPLRGEVCGTKAML